jgi:hypothetical protein
VIITYIHSDRLEDQTRIQLRCRNLADAINRTGSHRASLLDLSSFTQNTPKAQKICAESDILVIYRYLYGPILKAIEYWKARDKKVIVDFDQALNYLTPDMPDYSFWVEGEPLAAFNTGKKSLENPIDPVPLEQFKWGLGMVDAATVPSARLADDWSQFTDVHELPDYLNTCQYPILDQSHENEIWIGLGQDIQYTSFKNSGFSTAMEHVCQKYPQVRLVLCGSGKYRQTSLKIDPAQIVFFFPCFFDEWVSILLKLDIGVVPIYGDYDLRLSPINMHEFMIAKIPWIATKQAAFNNLASYGHWTQNSPEAWKFALLNTIDHLAVYRKKAVREPFLFVLGQDVSANIEKVLKIYSAIINQMPG